MSDFAETWPPTPDSGQAPAPQTLVTLAAHPDEFPLSAGITDGSRGSSARCSATA